MPDPEDIVASPRHKARPREYRDGEEFGTYINHFERVATANGWPDATKLVQLETVLKGKAQRDFEAFIEESPEITWGQMIVQLKDELIPSVQKSLDAFAQLRMDGISPKELYASLVRLSKLSHGEMNAESRHIIVRAQMLQALPKKLRHDAGKQEYLSGLDKENLLKLLTRIYDAEMKEEAENQSYEPMINRVQGEVYRSTESRMQDLEKENSKLKEDIGEVKDMVKEILKQGKSTDKGYQSQSYGQGLQSQSYGQRRGPPSMENVRCYRCQQNGHYARNCDKPQVCSYCKKEGHSYMNCTQNPKNA
jgi:rubrerythrin